jgi:anthranilate phosphoribosyltransferase
MILDALHRIANHGQSLARAEEREVMAEVLAGNCPDPRIAALLMAWRMKGETVEEIVAALHFFGIDGVDTLSG